MAATIHQGQQIPQSQGEVTAAVQASLVDQFSRI